MKGLVFLTVLALASVIRAQYNVLDQIDPVTESLGETPSFGVMQIFEPSLEQYNSTILDDFVATGDNITSVGVAFTITHFEDTSLIKGWRISFWDTTLSARGTDTQLIRNTLASTYVTSGIKYTDLEGISSGFGCRADISGLDIALRPGLVWMGMAPEVAFNSAGQTFILTQSTPVNRGGGAVRNSFGINPGKGFTGSVSHPVNTDVAYGVGTVPEPSLAMIAPVLAALMRRKRVV